MLLSSATLNVRALLHHYAVMICNALDRFGLHPLHFKHNDFIRLLAIPTRHTHIASSLGIHFMVACFSFHHNDVVGEVDQGFGGLLGETLSLGNENHSRCLEEGPEN